MKFFDPKKHIWSGIFGSFKDCEKSKKCNNFFEAKNWLQGQDELVKEIALKKRKTNLLIKFLKTKKKKIFSLFDFGDGCALEYFNIISKIGVVPKTYYLKESSTISRNVKKRKLKNVIIAKDFKNINMVDYFYASDSIHYINKKRTLFNFFKKKVKKNIIISGLLTNLHEFVSEQHFYGSWTPVRFYNLNDFNEEMKNIGFELENKRKKKVKYFGIFQNPPMTNFPKEYQNAFKYDLIYKRVK